MIHALPNLLKNQKSGVPKTFFLIVNGTCNAKCIMCDIGQRNESTFTEVMQSRGEMTIETLLNILKVDFSPVIRITSTEPLLYSKLGEAIQLIKEHGLKVSLTTNGYLLEKMAADLIDWGLDEIMVSMDGIPEINDKIRGIPLSQRAINGLKYIRDNSEIKRGINTVIQPLNQEVIYETVESLKDLVDYHLLSHLGFITEKCANIHNSSFPQYPIKPSILMVDRGQIDAGLIFDQLQRIKTNFDHVSIIPEMISKEQVEKYYYCSEDFIFKKPTCRVPWESAQFGANGDLMISTRCFNIDFGNINKYPFNEIWNGDKMRQFRKDIRKNGAFPACCRCCGVF